MNDLGYVIRPEQYARVDNECVLSDSVVALDFFKDFYPEQGVVFLAFFYLAKVKDPFLPVWVYFIPKEEKIIAAAPVFKCDTFSEMSSMPITKTKLLEDECYFYWNNQLYAAVFTSTGETVIRHVRCILSNRDMLNVAGLDESIEIEDVFPVNLYNLEDGRFLSVCWMLETENACWYETVCSDDDARIDKIDVHKTFSHPININERVIIGDDIYFCRYNENFGIYFDKTNFKATEKDRAELTLPPPPRVKTKEESEPPRPKLKIIFNKDEMEKKEAANGGKPKIVSMFPRK